MFELTVGRKKETIILLFLMIGYILISIILLELGKGEVQKGIYNMWVPCDMPSEILGAEADYCQGFYTPCDVVGIELYLIVPETKIYDELILRFYRGSDGEFLGESKIVPEQISEDGKVSFLFMDFVLDEGEAYFFEVNTNLDNEIPIQIWMGDTSSGYGLNVSYQGEELEGKSLVYNLLYNYTNKTLVLWMFLTVGFLVLFVTRAIVVFERKWQWIYLGIAYIVVWFFLYEFIKLK